MRNRDKGPQGAEFAILLPKELLLEEHDVDWDRHRSDPHPRLSMMEPAIRRFLKSALAVIDYVVIQAETGAEGQ